MRGARPRDSPSSLDRVEVGEHKAPPHPSQGSSRSSEIAQETLSSLLDDICLASAFNKSNFDHGQPEAAPTDCSPEASGVPGPEPEPGRVHHLLSDLVDDDSILDSSTRGHLNILQLKVRLQPRQVLSCGYFSLHNALSLLRGLTRIRSQQNARDFLSYALSSEGSVWEQYWAIRRFLEDYGDRNRNPDGTRAYHWDEKTIRTGVLERKHSEVLLKRFHRATKEAGRLSAVPEITERNLDSLCEVFSRERTCHAFVIGNIDHWNVLVLNKLSPTRIELIVADSRNVPLLKHLDVDHARRNPKYTDNAFKQMVYIEYLVRAQRNLNTFADAALGQDLRVFYADQWIRRILGNFDDHLKECGKLLSSDIVGSWLKHRCPPAMVRTWHVKEIEKVGPHHLSKQCLHDLDAWICKLRAFEASPGCEGLTSLLEMLSKYPKELLI